MELYLHFSNVFMACTVKILQHNANLKLYRWIPVHTPSYTGWCISAMMLLVAISVFTFSCIGPELFR
jgi:hypothetical protein